MDQRDVFRMRVTRAIDWRAERDRVDLAAVATNLLGPAPGRRGEHGRRLWWSCPLHDDRNPSFAIDPGRPFWRCFGCGEHGDAATLVMRVRSCSFPEALAYLTGDHARTGRAPLGPAKAPAARPRPQPSGLPEPEALALVEGAASALWTSAGSDALCYLTDARRLSPQTIRTARLGWTSSAEGVPWSPPGIVIPWFDGPRLALVKVRPPDDWRERFPPSKRPPKYLEAFRDPARVSCYPGPESIRAGRPLIATEGELDALALGEALGEWAAVVTLGSASAEPSPDILGRFLGAAAWFVATDADPAGDKAADRWPARARRVRPPEPFKDWTDARVAGVDLARWWRDRVGGNPRPPLFSWEELATWRWGGATEADTGLVIDHTDPVKAREAVSAALADTDDPERAAIRGEAGA